MQVRHLAPLMLRAARNDRIVKQMLNVTGTGLSDGGCGVFAHAVTMLLPEAEVFTQDAKRFNEYAG